MCGRREKGRKNVKVIKWWAIISHTKEGQRIWLSQEMTNRPNKNVYNIRSIFVNYTARKRMAFTSLSFPFFFFFHTNIYVVLLAVRKRIICKIDDFTTKQKFDRYVWIFISGKRMITKWKFFNYIDLIEVFFFLKPNLLSLFDWKLI